MAGESRQPGRSRSVSGTPGDTPDLSSLESEASTAPITANTPLPPLPPLPLASQSGAGGAAPQPPPGGWSAPTDQPALPPLPPNPYPSQAPAGEVPPRAADPGITSGWAARTTFALMLTSAILLAAMGIAYTAITKSGGLLIWVVVIIVVVNIIYPLVVFSIARPGPAQPFRLPFLNPRRGP